MNLFVCFVCFLIAVWPDDADGTLHSPEYTIPLEGAEDLGLVYILASVCLLACLFAFDHLIGGFTFLKNRHKDDVSTFAICGTIIATGGFDGVIILWHFDSARCICKLYSSPYFTQSTLKKEIIIEDVSRLQESARFCPTAVADSELLITSLP